MMTGYVTQKKAYGLEYPQLPRGHAKDEQKACQKKVTNVKSDRLPSDVIYVRILSLPVHQKEIKSRKKRKCFQTIM